MGKSLIAPSFFTWLARTLGTIRGARAMNDDGTVLAENGTMWIRPAREGQIGFIACFLFEMSETRYFKPGEIVTIELPFHLHRSIDEPDQLEHRTEGGAV